LAWPAHDRALGNFDPAAVQGTTEQVERAFRDSFFMLDRRISLFLSLPLSSLDRLALKREIDKIGQQSTSICAPAPWRSPEIPTLPGI
jgi:arsenate reductase